MFTGSYQCPFILHPTPWVAHSGSCTALLHWRLPETPGAKQGSPLVPADLRKVAAASAAATVIVSDSSRCVWSPAHACVVM